MDDNNKWTNLTISQKNDIFTKYIKNENEKNEKNHENGIIDILIYNKNKFFLKTLKEDKNYFKKLKEDDIIIKNDNIYQIKNIKEDKDGLIDYNFEVIKDIKYKKKIKTTIL